MQDAAILNQWPPSQLEIDNALDWASFRWENPSEYFSHGMDKRSSDQGLMVAFYGGLMKSSQHNWQNGGRVLVDRTDIRILLDSYQLPLPFKSLDVCCREMDLFVRDQFFSYWSLFEDLSSEVAGSDGANSVHFSKELSTLWLDVITHDIFAHEDYRPAAALVLFFLCPALPVYPGTWPMERWQEVQGLLMNKATFVQPNISVQGNESKLMQAVFSKSDWWVRRVVWAMEQRRLRQQMD